MNNAEKTAALARKFIERAEALRYKGRRRDDAALDFFCGAATVVEESDPPLYAHLGAICAMVISPRGFAGVLWLATAA